MEEGKPAFRLRLLCQCLPLCDLAPLLSPLWRSSSRGDALPDWKEGWLALDRGGRSFVRARQLHVRCTVPGAPGAPGESVDASDNKNILPDDDPPDARPPNSDHSSEESDPDDEGPHLEEWWYKYSAETNCDGVYMCVIPGCETHVGVPFKSAQGLAGHMWLHHGWRQPDRATVISTRCSLCKIELNSLEIARLHRREGRCRRSRPCHPLAAARAGLRDLKNSSILLNEPHEPVLPPLPSNPVPRGVTEAVLIDRLRTLKFGPRTGPRQMLWDRVVRRAQELGVEPLGPV